MNAPCPIKEMRKPGPLPPPGVCDCHFHIFSPLKKYPMITERGYTQPETTLADYERMQTTLGIECAVFVQPSRFGTDNRATLEALSRMGLSRARWVVVVDSTVSDSILAGHILHFSQRCQMTATCLMHSRIGNWMRMSVTRFWLRIPQCSTVPMVPWRANPKRHD